MAIDWTKFENKGKFISFEDNVVKKLMLTKWREDVAKFGTEPSRPALKFDVLAEDGVACEPPKEFTASNHTLVLGLRPFVEKADKGGRESITVALKRSGQGKGTNYMVIEAS